MTKLTKEFMQDIISGNGFGVAPSAVADMARQLLASMEQEPVYQVLSGDAWVDLSKGAMESQARVDATVRILYAAPQLPQPAVAITQHFDTIALDTAKMVMCDVNRRDEFLGGDIQLLSRIQCRIDEACRAAMLQGAEPVQEQPQTAGSACKCRSSEKVQVLQAGWVAVPVEPTAEMISEGIAAHYERSQTQIHDRPAPGPMECAYRTMVKIAQRGEAE